MPNATPIARYLKPSQRFARSVHLERDFADSTALDNYVVTEKVNQLCRRFAAAFGDGSTERAWRVTGDYGTGKSCFALAVARLCDRKGGRIPRQLAPLSRALPNANAMPILVTGSREPISVAIIRALKVAVGGTKSRRTPPTLRHATRALKRAEPADRDRFAIEMLEQTARFVSTTKNGKGVLLVLDELGKSLEFATQNPAEQDITFLQTLAETASRSGSTPLVVLGILHQGFSAYADRMDAIDQREWDKIGGRFEELLFDQPLEQLVALVSNALGVKVDRLPDSVIRTAKANMANAIDLGWFGAITNRRALIDQAPAIYPLQPMLLPVLIKCLCRFGQNERSLFSFLYSADGNALRAFAAEHSAGAGFFGIHHLYDFMRSSIGHRLHTRSLSSRWTQIESVIDASLAGNEPEVAMLKTVGVLNMLDDQKLTATEPALQNALSHTCLPVKPAFSKTLDSLRTKQRVLYFRGNAGGYCLWPYTSVNLELKYAEAERVISRVDDVADAVAEHLVQRPVVARRHYVKTGTLRHFDVVYVRAKDLAATVKQWEANQADGAIIVPFCQTKAERSALVQLIPTLRLGKRNDVLIAVPQPLGGFSGLVAEIRRWEWIQTNVEELAGDKHAREEVSRQIAAARSVLLDRTRNVLDVRSFRRGQGMEWFHKGKVVPLESSRELFCYVSTICDKVFHQSPQLRNELLNRRKLSSAAAAARMRLIERILDNASEDLLGMDPTRKPPEMSMYLSALKHTALHFKGGAGSRIQLPKPAQDTCNLLPMFSRMRNALTKEEGKRVVVADLFAELRKAPIGARDGLLPLMLVVFCVAEAQHVAIYEGGMFLQDIGGAEFARLTRAPETFELQYCKLSGVRAEVFNQLLQVVDSDVDMSRTPDLIDVVRPLCQFAAALPDYSRNTADLSKKTLAVRDALLSATEPATLLFDELPVACGLSRVPVRKRLGREAVRKYVTSLKRALGELRSAYPALLSRIESRLSGSFGESSGGEELRSTLERKAGDLSVHVTEPTLKALCLRIADGNLPRDKWIESIGSLVVAKPPRHWYDRDVPRFSETIKVLARRFEETASMAFAAGNSPSMHAMRVSILQANGIEVSCVLELSTEEETAASQLEKQVNRLLEKNSQLAIAVTSRALLKRLSRGAGN